MEHDFLLLNGDTIFDKALLMQVLNSVSAPITLSVSLKPIYDADDMKVQLDGNGWVKHVSKNLSADQIDCESIGLIFGSVGPAIPQRSSMHCGTRPSLVIGAPIIDPGTKH